MRRGIGTEEPNVTTIGARTSDRVALRGVREQYRGAADPGTAFVVGHGFTGRTGKPTARRVLRRFAAHATVYALDFRGHGRSGGGTTVGGAEIHDLAAAVALARADGYSRVATVGFSMGGSVVLRHAALLDPPDAVAAISAPARWWARDTVPIRRVHYLLESPLGRAVAPLLGARLAGPWGYEPPESPLDVVGRIAPTPLLLVHGDADHYFPAEHATSLHAEAGGDAELWLEPGMAHAETAMTPRRVDRIARWLLDRAAEKHATEKGEPPPVASPPATTREETRGTR